MVPMPQMIAPRLTSWPLATGFVPVVLPRRDGSALAHCGTAVFFETIREGFVACFG
jgi:hypothetical protein